MPIYILFTYFPNHMHNFCGSYSWLAFANLMFVPAEIPNQAGTEEKLATHKFNTRNNKRHKKYHEMK